MLLLDHCDFVTMMGISLYVICVIFVLHMWALKERPMMGLFFFVMTIIIITSAFQLENTSYANQDRVIDQALLHYKENNNTSYYEETYFGILEQDEKDELVGRAFRTKCFLIHLQDERKFKRIRITWEKEQPLLSQCNKIK